MIIKWVWVCLHTLCACSLYGFTTTIEPYWPVKTAFLPRIVVCLLDFCGCHTHLNWVQSVGHLRGMDDSFTNVCVAEVNTLLYKKKKRKYKTVMKEGKQTSSKAFCYQRHKRDIYWSMVSPQQNSSFNNLSNQRKLSTTLGGQKNSIYKTKEPTPAGPQGWKV